VLLIAADTVSKPTPGLSRSAEYLSLDIILLCIKLAENVDTGRCNFDLL